MFLFEIIGQDEVLDIFKCLSRKQLVTFAISARCFAQLSASAAIHSVHLVDNFRDAVKLAGSNKEEDKEMFLALQNALQYEETRKHYRIVDQFYRWKRARNPHPDELSFIRQCFPLMSGGLRIVTKNYPIPSDQNNYNYAMEPGWDLEVVSKLNFFRGACTEINFDWGFCREDWPQVLTNPTVLAARSLSILNSTKVLFTEHIRYNIVYWPKNKELVNWLWQPFADNANGEGLGRVREPQQRELTLQLFDYQYKLIKIVEMLKQKFEYSLENNELPLPNFLLRFIDYGYGNFPSPQRQYSIEPIQKMVDSKNNVVAKFEFINCPLNNNLYPFNYTWEIRQFYGQMKEGGDINQQETDDPVILLLDYDEEIDSSDSEFVDEEEVEENMEWEIEDNGNQQQ